MVAFVVLAVVVAGAVLYFASRSSKAKAVVAQEVAKVEGKAAGVKAEIENAVKGAEKP